jgi:hypothetical protein
MGVVGAFLLAALGLAALGLRLWGSGARSNSAYGPGSPVRLPTPSAAALLKRSHHEKLHDAKYLSLILEAELEPEDQDSPPPSGGGQGESPLP